MKKIFFPTITIFLLTCFGGFSNSPYSVSTDAPQARSSSGRELLDGYWMSDTPELKCELAGNKVILTALEDLTRASIEQTPMFAGGRVPAEGLTFTVEIEGLGSTWDIDPDAYPLMLVNNYKSSEPAIRVPFDRGDGKYTLIVSPGHFTSDYLSIRAFHSVNSFQSAGNTLILTPSLTAGIPEPSGNVYSFSYDGMSRLTDAIYYENDQPSDSYSEKGITYDHNGNILTLNRSDSDNVMHDLSYIYDGNRLITLDNSGTASPGTYHYTYDNNGNMTYDGRQGVGLEYNHLNLVGTVREGNGGDIKAYYTWLADGTKLTVNNFDNDEHYEYLGSLVYKWADGELKLESAAFSEGRIYATSVVPGEGPVSARPANTGLTGPAIPLPRDPDPIDPVFPLEPVEPEEPGIPVWPVDPWEPVEPEEPDIPTGPVDPVDPVDPIEPVEPGDEGDTGGPAGPGENPGNSYNYQVAYFIKDHLGSVRVVVDNAGNVLSRHDYYPFGLTWPNPGMQTGTNRYLYNGKELQQFASLDYLDYGVRMYDRFLGRWQKIDRLAEKYLSTSPYAYVLGSPINALDPDGNLTIFVNGFDPKYAAKQTISSAGKSVMGGAVPILISALRPYQTRDMKTSDNYGWAGVDEMYKDAYKDENAMYLDGGYDPRYNGTTDRFEAGKEQAEMMVKEGIQLKDGEKIRIVGYSMGAAYAAGMVSVFAQHDNWRNLIEFVDYIAPHKPKKFNHDKRVLGRQYNSTEDRFTRRRKIEGVDSSQHFQEDIRGFGGGHLLNNLNNWIQMCIDRGISVTVR